jgi:hypothetical protein
MEYMLFIATDTEPDTSTDAPDVDEWVAEGQRRGIRIRGDALRPLEDATTVRIRDGQVLVTDGPYTSPRSGSSGTTSWSARTSTRRSTTSPGIRWPTTVASRFVR